MANLVSEIRTGTIEATVSGRENVPVLLLHWRQVAVIRSADSFSDMSKTVYEKIRFQI
jgi:hypothetical protein